MPPPWPGIVLLLPSLSAFALSSSPERDFTTSASSGGLKARLAAVALTNESLVDCVGEAWNPCSFSLVVSQPE